MIWLVSQVLFHSKDSFIEQVCCVYFIENVNVMHTQKLHNTVTRFPAHIHISTNNRFSCLHMTWGECDRRVLTVKRWQKHSMALIFVASICRFFFLLLPSLLSLRCYLVKRKCLYSSLWLLCCVISLLLDHFVLPHLILFAVCIYVNANKGSHNKLSIAWHSIDFWFLLFFTRKRIYLATVKVKPIPLSIFLIVCKQQAFHSR